MSFLKYIHSEYSKFINILSKRKYAASLRDLINETPWCVDDARYDGEILEIRGWAIAPSGLASKVTFTVNESEFEEIEYPIARHDIEELFWYYPGTEKSAFICRTPVKSITQKSEKYFKLQYIDKKTLKPTHPFHAYYFNPLAGGMNPVPDPVRRTRVHGADSEISFLMEGFTAYTKLNNILIKYLNRELSDFNEILDWGCGCGRLSRYFSQLENVLITGVDIDKDNVSWCAENLAFAEFFSIPLHPPTPIKPEKYDLLIGISIFTHLREESQFEWLEELSRISSNDAILMMTIHGFETIARSNLPLQLYKKLVRYGFLDAGSNTNLSDAIDDQDYYRNCFHTHEYIYSNWSKVFEIIDIIPGSIGNHQDLVLMRKRIR